MQWWDESMEFWWNYFTAFNFHFIVFATNYNRGLAMVESLSYFDWTYVNHNGFINTQQFNNSYT